MLCAQVLMLGITVGDHLTVYKNTIDATIGHSVLLPVAYNLTDPFSKYTVEWEFGNESILYHTVMKCTLDSQGSPSSILDETFVVYPIFSGRVEFYKLNSSLLIYNAQVNDSGTYRISFSTTQVTSSQNISVTVSGSAAASTWGIWMFAFWKVLCVLPLAAYLIVLRVRG